MTTFYVDSDNGNDANDGLGTGAGNAWATIDKFTETASGRTAGDICICRNDRVASIKSGTTALTFAWDGTADNPNIIEMDYDDAWSDHANSAQTYTVTFGSVTMTASATITGISAGDMVYVTSDDQRLYSYEVDSVSGTTLTLFLPYKGGQAGSTKTLVVMGAPPFWGTTAEAQSWDTNDRDFWDIKGIKINAAEDKVVVDVSTGWRFYDCIFLGDSTIDAMVRLNASWTSMEFHKCRSSGSRQTFENTTSTRGWFVTITDCLFDGNSTASSYGVEVVGSDRWHISDSEFKGMDTGDIVFNPNTLLGVPPDAVVLKNCLLSSTNKLVSVSSKGDASVRAMDWQQTPGDTRLYSFLSVDDSTPIMQSEESVVRSGGGTVAIKVTPSTKLGTGRGLLKVFDIPIYLTATATTLTVYFRGSSTADWTANPTAAELWIEAEYWNHATNNHRALLKSTGTLDLVAGAHDYTQSLAVTFTPAQAGVVFLRCWYGKSKESGKNNYLYVDPLPAAS